MSLNPEIWDWHGRVAWLIGASSGIGRATAELLHARGARVVGSARHAGALEDFCTAHPGSGALALDSTDARAVRSAALEVGRRHGRVELALYAAAITSP